jgi:ParB family chromosome partitioning protein
LGLSALVPVSPPAPVEGSKKEGIHEIEVERIVPNRYQPRQTFRPEALASLAESLKTQGLIQPIVVRTEENGKFELVAGERRWRAARLAGFTKIPAIVRNVQGQELMEWALLENIQREELHPIEKAQAYAKLVSEFSMTQEEIATRIGIDRSSVANILRLLQLPEALWKEIAEGTLTMGHAKAILALEEKKDQLRLAEEIKRNGWSVRQAEAWSKKIKSASPERAAKEGARPKSPEIADIEDRLRRSLGTKVQVTPRGKGGEIQIEYYTLDDLDRLLEKLT